MSPDHERYFAAAKKMQCGVEFTMDPAEVGPKSLRVGINSAMSDQAGLVKLLIEKGVITEEEYIRAIAGAMENEAERYQKKLEAKYPGKKIELH